MVGFCCLTQEEGSGLVLDVGVMRSTHRVRRSSAVSLRNSEAQVCACLHEIFGSVWRHTDPHACGDFETVKRHKGMGAGSVLSCIKCSAC